MIQSVFIGLIYNAALLLALGIIFDSITLHNYRNNLLAKLITGISLGCIVLAIMLNPWVLKPGVVFDTRSILLSLTALFFGFLPTAIATIIALTYRLIQGGAGVYMGCSVIAASVLWGWFWRILRKRWNKPYNFFLLYSLGIVTHVTMLSLTLLLPSNIRFDVFKSIALPVIVLYPFVTVVLGKILARRILRRQEKLELEKSEKQLRNLYEQAPIAYQSLDANGNFLTVNETWLQIMGYQMEEVIGKNFGEFLIPEDQENFLLCFPNFKATGHVEGIEFHLVKNDGSHILVSFDGKIVSNEDGVFLSTQCVFADITERRKQESALRSIEWMLTKQHVESDVVSIYWDLNDLNKSRLILDSIGIDVLKELMSDYISLLDTSAAVYELNGDYATVLLSSSWCQYLDKISKQNCTEEVNEGTATGSLRQCHVRRWKEIAQKVINSGEVGDEESPDGLCVYTVPIITSNGIIGCINLSYGSPPTAESELIDIATRFQADVSELKQKALQYQARPPYIVEQAKRKLHTAAKIIAEIVERKQAETELLKAKKEWENIFQAIPHPTIIVDHQQNILSVNRLVEKVLDKDTTKLHGLKCWEVFHGSDATESPIGCPFKSIGDSDTPIIEEMEVEAMGGYHLVSCKPIFDDRGKLSKVIHITTDITARKKAEIALKESQSRFELFMDQIPGNVFIKDEDSRILYVNKHMEQIHKAEDWIGKRPAEILPDNEVEESISSDKKTLETGYYQATDAIKNAEGIIHYYDTTKFRMVREDGNVMIGGLSLDITERKLAKDELNKYTRRMEIINEIDSIILETLSFETVCQNVVDKLRKLIPCSLVSINEFSAGMNSITAISRDTDKYTFIETNKPYKVSIDFINELKTNKNFVIDDAMNEPISSDFKVRTKLTEHGERSFMYNSLIVQGEVFGFLASSANEPFFFTEEYQSIANEIANQLAIIMHQLRLLDEIKQHVIDLETKVEERTYQLQIANKEMESFSYTVAHDLRSPLRAIDGFSTILLEDYSSVLDAEGKKLLTVIKNNALKMGALIKELLDLAKLNPYSMKYTQVDMNELVSVVLDSAVSAENKAMFNIKLDKLPKVNADASLLQQVWENLVANAIKFTQPQAKKEIVIGSIDRPLETVFFVRDSGVGFDVKYMDKIFGAFQRLHSNSEFEGNGIGLAIVKKIIQRHNGDVWAETEIGKGSTFYFSIPKQN